ncbi:glycosyltransferase [Desulfoferrobacter suflitae]|uniref:glycosyltransferase n=1 Tax=Desulfoferrobacter suflitae TaxID=2865782 RepID=UPI0021642B71|nr:glycosyltransferase [Desulfoferrobacter suflitae]MCK8600212.1 glycosyltransferase [Desulfoferrobacter suflitae]
MNPKALRVLVLTKRQYMKKDLLDDRYGRMRELPLGLALRGHQVRGLCLSYAHREESDHYDGPVHWTSINATALKAPGLVRFIHDAALLARHCDVIWAGSDSFYGVIACLLGRRYKVPVVFDLYDNFASFAAAKLPILKQLYRWALRECAGVTCNGWALARLIRSSGRRKPITVIETTARTDLFKPMDQTLCRARMQLPKEALLVGYAGAIYQNRGVDLLFKAFHQLQQKYPQLCLAVAGPREPQVRMPQSPRLFDLGILPFKEIPYFTNALDVAVICNSDNDFGRYCFPQKAWEIMACDVPLIAAGVEGMREFFEHHPQWLYAPNDSNELALALERRLQDRSTDYPQAPSWYECAGKLEEIMEKSASRRLYVTEEIRSFSGLADGGKEF